MRATQEVQKGKYMQEVQKGKYMQWNSNRSREHMVRADWGGGGDQKREVTF